MSESGAEVTAETPVIPFAPTPGKKVSLQGNPMSLGSDASTGSSVAKTPRPPTKRNERGAGPPVTPKRSPGENSLQKSMRVSDFSTPRRPSHRGSTSSRHNATSSPSARSQSSPNHRRSSPRAGLSSRASPSRKSTLNLGITSDPKYASYLLPRPVERSLYPVPDEPSLIRSMMQNVTLCSLGGLHNDCPEILFRSVLKEEVTRSSNALMYLYECEKLGVTPHEDILRQISPTAGRRNLYELNCAGLALGPDGIRATFPLLRENPRVRTLSFRFCNVDSVAAELLHVLGTVEHYSELELLDLSCNATLKDEHLAELEPFIRLHPNIVRVSLQKCALSKELVHRVVVLANENKVAKLEELTEEEHKRRQQAELAKFFDKRSRQSLSFATLSNAHFRRESTIDIARMASAREQKEKAKRNSVWSAAPPLVGGGFHDESDGEVKKPAKPAVKSVVGEQMRERNVYTIKPPFVITQQEFRDALTAFRALMNKTTCVIDLHVFAEEQPHCSKLARARIANRVPPVDTINFMVFLESRFPRCARAKLIEATAHYSEYALLVPVQRANVDRMRVDQREEMQRMFDRLDLNGDGEVSRDELQAMLSEAGREAAEMIMDRRGWETIDFRAFASLTLPYLIEAKRRKRWR